MKKHLLYIMISLFTISLSQITHTINAGSYYFEPSDKLLLIFPSEMFHQVEQNKSNITRYSLAFNAIPKGLVGDRTTDSHLYV